MTGFAGAAGGLTRRGAPVRGRSLVVAVVLTLAACLLAVALVFELWLFVLAVPVTGLLTAQSWWRRTRRELPAAVALEAVASVDRGWTGERRIAGHLAVMAGRDPLVLAGAVDRLGRVSTEPSKRGEAEALLRRAMRVLDERPLPSLEPVPRRRPALWLAVASAATLALLWVVPSSRWWLLPLAGAYTALVFATRAVLVRHQQPDAVARAATEILISEHGPSVRRLATLAADRGVLRRAERLVGEAALPPALELAATELLHEAAAVISLEDQREATVHHEREDP